MKTIPSLYWIHSKFSKIPIYSAGFFHKFSFSSVWNFPRDLLSDKDACISCLSLLPIPIRLIQLKVAFPEYESKELIEVYKNGDYKRLIKELKSKRGKNINNWGWVWVYPIIEINLPVYKFFKFDKYINIEEIIFNDKYNSDYKLDLYYKNHPLITMTFEHKIPCQFLNIKRDKLIKSYPDIIRSIYRNNKRKELIYDEKNYIGARDSIYLFNLSFEISYYSGLLPLYENETRKPIPIL